jgi:hypothetical protein
MVKGNWERRAELVAARRIEERSQKAAKAAGSKQFATGESVVTKLMRDPWIEQSGSTVEAWLKGDSDGRCCQAWLRTEQCATKKCKLSHEISVAHLANVPYDASRTTTEGETACTGPTNLRDVAKKDYNRLYFVAVNGTCVYDYSYPEVWSEWIQQRAVLTAGMDNRKMAAIPEEGARRTSEDNIELAAENGRGADDTAESTLCAAITATTITTADFAAFFLDPQNQSIVPFGTVVSNIMLFLDATEAAAIAMTNKQIYQHCLKTELFRLRRREGQAAYLAGQSKAKKQEKKKKAKQANAKKESKKDGFARGGNSH